MYRKRARASRFHPHSSVDARFRYITRTSGPQSSPSIGKKRQLGSNFVHKHFLIAYVPKPKLQRLSVDSSLSAHDVVWASCAAHAPAYLPTAHCPETISPEVKKTRANGALRAF